MNKQIYGHMGSRGSEHSLRLLLFILPLLMLTLHWSFGLGRFLHNFGWQKKWVLVYFNILSSWEKNGNEIKDLDELQKAPIGVIDMNHFIVCQNSTSNQRFLKSIVLVWQWLQNIIVVYFWRYSAMMSSCILTNVRNRLAD